MKKIVDNSEVGVRSNQNLSFNWLGSADFGRIIPFHVQELLGTDKIVRLKPKFELQMLPLASPTFSKIDVYCHYFFVPTRLVWKNALDFFSQSGENQNAVPPYWHPTDFADAYTYEDPEQSVNFYRALYKHWTSMGLPPFFAPNYAGANHGLDRDLKISVLPLRAYAQVWWDFYRDTELIPDSNKSQYLDDSDGYTPAFGIDDVPYNPYVPYSRSIKDCWIADLFVSSGLDGMSVGLPFASESLNSGLAIDSTGRAPYFQNVDGVKKVKTNLGDSITNNDILVEADSATIRRMEALTRLSERLSLSGKRQIDKLFSLYGIKPEFSKLSMSQYIGGAKTTVLISDITATATTAFNGSGYVEGSALGQKAGAGYANFRDLSIEYTASEPGYLLGVVSIMPHIHFVQGLGREWFRNELFDFFRRELEHTGQVAVPRQEVGVTYGTYQHQGAVYSKDQNEQTFAFTQPYYDYKRKMDVLAGDFMYYHGVSNPPSEYYQDIAYMQSMGMYLDFPTDREYNAENMLLKARECNRIFYYLGGNLWENKDDHFFLDIDIDCLINRPMDGFAVPTLETTEDPHLKTSPVGSSFQL